MQKLFNQHKHLSPAESNQPDTDEKECWEEYSTLHDSFAEQLSYEKGQRRNSDFWQLNYI